jgi:hypothetical protein
VYRVYTKHEGVLSLDLSSLPKIAHYVCANTPKAEKIPNPKHIWSQAFETGEREPVIS